MPFNKLNIKTITNNKIEHDATNWGAFKIYKNWKQNKTFNKIHTNTYTKKKNIITDCCTTAQQLFYISNLPENLLHWLNPQKDSKKNGSRFLNTHV